MTTKDRLKSYEARISKVEYEIVIEIHKRLIHLFKEMKKIQPYLERSHSGMGVWSISGKYCVETYDIKEVLEEYPEIKPLRYIRDNVVYDATQDDHFEDFIDDVVTDKYRDENDIDVYKFLNDACFEFCELYDYIQKINHTTIFDGVNENGVIVSYGRGSCLNTFTEAKASIQVQMLHKNNVPIVFFNSDNGRYFNRKYLSF